ncbi:MAG: NAD-dependent protein deacylase [Ruminococcus sp.]|jgi:NAD-dependent deacetylase|nr:NAD-dependent protein deacylase [Ruminococcus sp.]
MAKQLTHSEETDFEAFEEKRKQLRELIDGSDNIVFFGGAGVSTESGIPDFRGKDGLYNQTYKYPPEEIISRRFFAHHTDEFFEFYTKKCIAGDAKPNAAHIELARLEALGKLSAVITQNIDGLHTDAGSKNVYEIHGSVRRNYCLSCGKMFDEHYILGFGGFSPSCDICGGLVRPDIVLYGENLPEAAVENSIKAIKEADMLIVGGTSLTVYPASGFVDYYKGNKLVLINKTPTEYDMKADLLIRGSIGHALRYEKGE